MKASHAAVAERLSGRLLIAFTYVSVGLLVIGVVLMIANGISPLDPSPGLDLATLASSLVALEPAAFLWLGLLAVIAAPIGRVIVAGIVYAADGDMTMVAISVAILAVIAIGIGSAIAVTV
jgi:uncharacterized membrane protein